MRDVILYVHDLRTSGVVRDAMLLAAHLAKTRSTTLVAGYGDGFFQAEAARGGFDLVILCPGRRPLARLAAVAPLRRWLHGRPKGAVLLSMGNMGHQTPFFATIGRRDIRRIYRISNEIARPDGLRGRIRMAWMKALLGDADAIAIVGTAMGRLPLFAAAIADGRAIEGASGVELDRARQLAQAPSPHPWFDEAVPLVLGIGRLRPQKNFDLLIEAVALARLQRRIRLAILGGGTAAERDQLAAHAAALGLGDDMLLAGETDNVFAWLAHAGAFALPSRWEGSSVALLEALAVGIPVVASRLAGDAAHVLGEGRFGLLFDGVSAQALADTLLVQLSEDRVLPGDRAAAFGLDAAFDVYAGLIDRVARGTAVPRAPSHAVSPHISI
jgi:hypothetical protein